jgi:hypothetical protein
MKKISITIAVLVLCIAILTVAIVASLTNSTSKEDTFNSTSTSSANFTENTTTPDTDTPAPSSVPTVNAIFSYLEDSRTEVGNTTKLVLSINATLTSDNSVTIDYSKFFLYVWIEGQNGSRGLLNMHYYTPTESGDKHLDNFNKIAVFKITFEFPSEAMGFDGYFVPFSTYTLSYAGQQVPKQS